MNVANGSDLYSLLFHSSPFLSSSTHVFHSLTLISVVSLGWCGFYQSLLVGVVISDAHLGHLLHVHAGDEVLGCVCVSVCVLLLLLSNFYIMSYVSFRFYLSRANLNNEHIESIRSSNIPDVVSVMHYTSLSSINIPVIILFLIYSTSIDCPKVLVKKCYGDCKRRQKRNWHLQQLDVQRASGGGGLWGVWERHDCFHGWLWGW